MTAAARKLAEIAVSNAFGAGVGVLLVAVVFEKVIRPKLDAKNAFIYVIDWWPGPFTNAWVNLWLTLTAVGVILSIIWLVLRLSFRGVKQDSPELAKAKKYPAMSRDELARLPVGERIRAVQPLDEHALVKGSRLTEREWMRGYGTGWNDALRLVREHAELEPARGDGVVGG